MNTQNQDYIIDYVGAENWEAVIEAFKGSTLEEIKLMLDDMFPTEDNSKLAQRIFDEVSNNN